MLRHAAILLFILVLAQAGLSEKETGERAGTAGIVVLEERAPDQMIDVIIVLKDQPAFEISRRIREEQGSDKREELKRLILTEREGEIREKARDVFTEREKTNSKIRGEIERATLVGQQELSRYIGEKGGAVKGRTIALNAIHARVPAGLLDEIRGREEVAQVSEARNDFRLFLDYSVPTVNASAWWSNGYNGSAVKVAVIDTGVNTSHEWMQLPGRGFEEECFAPGETNPEDEHGHGSHVAGIIASTHQTYKGVAHGLMNFVNARIFNSTGSASSEGVSNALEWTGTNVSAQVLSNSWGTPYKDSKNSCINTGATPDGESAFVRYLDALVDNYELVMVFAAGNDGECGERSISEEASAYNTIVVGAVSDFNSIDRSDDAIAYFSSRGPTYDGRKKPDITAPGVTIFSINYANNSSIGVMSGTSQAAPHVSGGAALLMEYGLTPLEVKALLVNSAEDKGTSGWDNAYGWGYMDLGKAFAYRNNTYIGNVTDQGARYYTGNISSKATLTWNRHVAYGNSSAFPVNDLDLYLYSFGNGSLVNRSDAWKDNVEQVVGSGEIVLKVHGYNVSNIVEEEYAIAADGDLRQAELGVSYNATPNLSVYDNGTFNISASIGILDLPVQEARVVVPENDLTWNQTIELGRIAGNRMIGIEMSPRSIGQGIVLTVLNVSSYGASIELQDETNITILDDDADAPNVTANRTSGNLLSGNYSLSVNASDESGWRLEVEYRYGNGSALPLNGSQTNETGSVELGYVINESEWSNYTGQVLWWRYKAEDLDADRANDSLSTEWTEWGAAGRLGNTPPSMPVQEYPIGIGLIGPAVFYWTWSTDLEGHNITYEIEIGNQTDNTTENNYTTSLEYGNHSWRIRAWDGHNRSDHTEWANFSMVLIEVNFSIGNDSEFNYTGQMELNATITAKNGTTQECTAEIESGVVNGTNSTRSIGVLEENNKTELNWTLQEIPGTGNISLLLTCNNQTIERRVVNVSIGDNSGPVFMNVTYNTTIEAGENQTITINATDNYGIDAVWVETAVENISASLSWGTEANGTYIAVWMPGLGQVNFTVWVNDTSGNRANATGRFNVTDTKAPELEVEIVPFVVAKDGNVSICAVALDYQTETIWMNISHGNTSELLFGANQTITNSTWLGVYNVTVFVNDTSGNRANTSGTFVVSEPVELEIVVPEGTVEIKAGDESISQVNGSSNLTLGAYEYEIVYRRNDTYKIALKNLNLTENTTIHMQQEDVLANATPSNSTGLEHAVLLNRTIAFKPNISVNGTEIGVSATVCIDHTGLNYSEGYLRVYKCEWDFGNSTCQGAWGELETYVDEMACSNVTSFSAFGLAENQKYCGNGILEAGEDCVNCPADAGACPSPPSSGGGGGGFIMVMQTKENETEENETQEIENRTEEPELIIEETETIEELLERLAREIKDKKEERYNTRGLEIALELAKEQYEKGNLQLARSLLADIEAGLERVEKIEEKKEEIVETKAAALEPVEKAVMAYLIGAMLAVAIGLIIVKHRIDPRYVDEEE